VAELSKNKGLSGAYSDWGEKQIKTHVGEGGSWGGNSCFLGQGKDLKVEGPQKVHWKGESIFWKDVSGEGTKKDVIAGKTIRREGEKEHNPREKDKKKKLLSGSGGKRGLPCRCKERSTMKKGRCKQDVRTELEKKNVLVLKNGDTAKESQRKREFPHWSRRKAPRR